MRSARNVYSFPSSCLQLPATDHRPQNLAEKCKLSMSHTVYAMDPNNFGAHVLQGLPIAFFHIPVLRILSDQLKKLNMTKYTKVNIL